MFSGYMELQGAYTDSCRVFFCDFQRSEDRYHRLIHWAPPQISAIESLPFTCIMGLFFEGWGDLVSSYFLQTYKYHNPT